jgi:protein phosphatase
VGDSRAYRLRGNRIEQLTFDHSLVWELQSSGHLPENGETSCISKNIITRSLGPNPTVQIDLEGPFPVQAGDTFLLCSDGLTGQVKDDEIGMVLSCLPPEEAAQTLIDLACLRGGPDNITVLIIRVPGPQVAQASVSDQSGSSVPSNVRPVHPLIWTVLGVTSLATIGLMVLDQMLLAMVCFLGAAAAGVTAFVQRYFGGDDQPQHDGRRFGRGPYVSCDSAPNRDLLGRLSEILRQLKDIAASENWTVDWDALHAYLARSRTAADAGKLADSAREDLRAITSLMAQLRRQRIANGDGGMVL